jgi:xanthine dehydrogenase iron-sulfur cluster and FAD-binding subunit A
MWQTYFQPTSLHEALELLHQQAGQARLVAGGTDVLVELQRGVRPTSTLIDISKLNELKYVRSENGSIHIGGLATHNDVIASPDCVQSALPLAQACWEVGAPQIRTRATIAGNLVTASPANDTITPLMALDAELVLVSKSGERVVRLHDFYLGVRRTVIKPNELVREIRFPKLQENQHGLFLKLGLRRAQAISVINVAFVLTMDGDLVSEARITLGCLASTIVHARSAETFLKGKRLDRQVCEEAGELACSDVHPIDDLRGSAAYRLATLAALVSDGLQRLAAGKQAEGWPETPVLLEDREPGIESQEFGARAQHAAPLPGTQNSKLKTINTIINDQSYQLVGAHTKSLLDALRENAGLTGTKEGCAEGECGACTVWLNGQAVMACLVPAPQAHNATVTTIEGLANNGDLHPLQQSFIEHAAVQCGYCIPGMLMAGAKLLEEQPEPTLQQTQVALSGNICRCTGYRKIFDAVLDIDRQEVRSA